MNVEQGVEVYLRERRGVLRPETMAKHRMTLNLFVRKFVGRHVGTITPAELIDWRNEHLGRLKESSRNKYIDRVNAFYRHLVRMGYVADNPVDRVDPLDEGPTRRIRLDPTVLPLILDAARHPRDRAVIAVALELLLRGGEIADLRVGDVEPGVLRVRVEKQKGELVEDEMAVSATLSEELSVWLREYRRGAGLVAADCFLFPQLRTRYVAVGQSAYFLAPAQRMAHPEAVIKYALAAAGVPVEKGTGVHAIRRTCARLLFDHLTEHEGMDRALGHVSSLMHHSSRRTTELYLGVTGDRVMRNKLVRNGGPTPLILATAGSAKPAVRFLAGPSA